MKKLFFIAFVLSGILTFGKGFAIKTGLNLSTTISKVGGTKQTTNDQYRKMLPGLHVGGSYAIDVYKGFYIEPGLQYSLKGDKFKATSGGDYDILLTRLHYLDVPVNFGYQYNFKNKKVGVFTYVGPYFGFALGGKILEKVKISGTKDKNSDKLEFGKDNLSRFDAGLNFGAGVEAKHLLIGFQYGLGLANLLGKNNRETYLGEKVSYQNRVLSITIGYRFNKDE